MDLERTTFVKCEPRTSSDGKVTWTQSAQRYSSDNNGFGRSCMFNFTVTKPYFVQDGVSLSTTPADAGVISSFYGFTSPQAIISNIVRPTRYASTTNLVYLSNQFAQKYDRLATVNQ